MSGGPDELIALAQRLARGEVREGAAAIASIVGDHDPAIARHLHRRAWEHGGGPWLGVGRAGALAVASTCHLTVDGFGHAMIAQRVAARDLGLRATLARAAAAIIGDAPVPAAPPLAGTAPLGVAWRRVHGALPRFAELAHALGVILHERGGLSPTIQIPVAPGAKDDPERWRRRVVHALVSVRFPDGRPEPVDAFARRLGAAIAREVDGGGLLTRLVAATAALPVPLAWKRRRIVGARDPRWDAPLEVLAGRASLSLLRIADAPPLVAVSAPGRALDDGDPRSTSVVTIVADRAGATITVSGTGATGTPQGAALLIDRLLARTPRAAVVAPGGSSRARAAARPPRRR